MSQYKAIAEYYDAEYENQPMLEHDVPFFLGHLPRKRQSILELAAGTGRCAIPLAQAGHHVIAVDFDQPMLDIASRKREAVGIKPRDLEVVHHDVLRLDLKQQFDFVCIFFNTLLNFSTRQKLDRLMQVVRRHLKPRGRFWVDIFNPDLELLSRRHAEHLDPAVFYVPALDRTVHRETEITIDATHQLQHVTFHYRWFDAHGQQHDETVHFDLTFLFPRELQLLIEHHDMKLERFYGNYDGSKLTNDSPRIIASCKLA
jgi:SAM-dependent methyltransferase